MYRPFTRRRVYFDRTMNAMVYLLPRLYPKPGLGNVGFYCPNPGSSSPEFMCLMSQDMPDLGGAGVSGVNIFCRWRYEAVVGEGMLDLQADGEVIDGYRRIDNITNEALGRFRATYGDAITKEDIFFYVYGLLHSPDFRETYAADLKKMLPRIPLVEDAGPFIDAGRALSEMHLGYESATPYPLDGLDGDAPVGNAAYDFFRVTKMRFGKPTADQRAAGERADRTTIVYNDTITLSGVPEAAYRYMLGSRSAIEWIIDRYRVQNS